MFASTMLTAPAQRVCFGSSLERRVFPLVYAPDRLGNQMRLLGQPHLGPGSYNNHEFDTIIYNVQKTPGSRRGYSFGSRTALRFPPCNKAETPPPWQYQQDHTTSKLTPTGPTPFNATAQRFKRTPSTSDSTPGPGTYAHDEVTNRKVSWPMSFGRPDWSSLPQIDKQSLKVKLASEEEYLKQRNRVSYLSLYY